MHRLLMKKEACYRLPTLAPTKRHVETLHPLVTTMSVEESCAEKTL
jgi:hypothetical protein